MSHTHLVYQFKINLSDIEPPIWRRIQVPADFSFYRFHHAIQDAMGWLNIHVHEFTMENPVTIDPEAVFVAVLEVTALIGQYFVAPGTKALYAYDFDNGWEHTIELEKILPGKLDFDYPVCLDGRRACPPEGCLGTVGYFKLLHAMFHKDHVDHDYWKAWLKDTPYEDLLPEVFDPDTIHFSFDI